MLPSALVAQEQWWAEPAAPQPGQGGGTREVTELCTATAQTSSNQCQWKVLTILNPSLIHVFTMSVWQTHIQHFCCILNAVVFSGRSTYVTIWAMSGINCFLNQPSVVFMSMKSLWDQKVWEALSHWHTLHSSVFSLALHRNMSWGWKWQVAALIQAQSFTRQSRWTRRGTVESQSTGFPQVQDRARRKKGWWIRRKSWGQVVIY